MNVWLQSLPTTELLDKFNVQECVHVYNYIYMYICTTIVECRYVQLHVHLYIYCLIYVQLNLHCTQYREREVIIYGIYLSSKSLAIHLILFMCLQSMHINFRESSTVRGGGGRCDLRAVDVRSRSISPLQAELDRRHQLLTTCDRELLSCWFYERISSIIYMHSGTRPLEIQLDQRIHTHIQVYCEVLEFPILQTNKWIYQNLPSGVAHSCHVYNWSLIHNICAILGLFVRS